MQTPAESSPPGRGWRPRPKWFWTNRIAAADRLPFCPVIDPVSQNHCHAPDAHVRSVIVENAKILELVGTRLGAAPGTREFFRDLPRGVMPDAKVATGERIDRTAILRMAADGMGASAIAKAMGCSPMQVYRLLNG